MNRTLLVGLALAASWTAELGMASQSVAADRRDDYDIVLMLAIEKVESGGSSKATGDGGRAVGILQIHPCMVDDVNRIIKLKGGREVFTYSDRRDVAKSRAMFWIFTDHYSSGAPREVIARRWNGGPRGDSKDATLDYWARVQSAIQQIEGTPKETP